MKQCHFKIFTPESKWIFILIENWTNKQEMFCWVRTKKMPSKIKMFPSCTQARDTYSTQRQIKDWNNKSLYECLQIEMCGKAGLLSSTTNSYWKHSGTKQVQWNYYLAWPKDFSGLQFALWHASMADTIFATIEILQRIIIRILDKCSMNILLLTGGRRGNLDREAKKQEET